MEEKTLPNSSYEDRNILILQADKDITRKYWTNYWKILKKKKKKKSPQNKFQSKSASILKEFYDMTKRDWLQECKVDATYENRSM